MGVPALREEKAIYLVDRADMGRADSLRYNVISYVREENYDKAVQVLADFMQKPSEYPSFHRRVERFIEHAIDLVRAVEMKRNFPGVNRLTAARQQDLKLKVKQHMDELIYCLKKVEHVEMKLRVEDVRSTVIIVHAVVLCSFAVALVAFLIELSQGLAVNALVVFDDIFQELATWAMNLF